MGAEPDQQRSAALVPQAWTWQCCWNRQTAGACLRKAARMSKAGRAGSCSRAQAGRRAGGSAGAAPAGVAWLAPSAAPAVGEQPAASSSA